MHKPDLSALSGLYIPDITNVKFHTLSNGVGRNALYEYVSQEDNWIPLNTNFIKFSISAPHNWMLENILTNDGALPDSGNVKFGIRFERLKHGSWRGIGKNDNVTVTNLVVCGPSANEIPAGQMYYNRDISTFNYIIGEKSPASFSDTAQYFVPMGDSKNGFIFYKQNGSLVKDDYSLNNYMFIPFTSEYMTFRETQHVTGDNTLHEYIFILKTVTAKGLMDRVTVRESSYRDILYYGTLIGQNKLRFKYNSKRVDIRGLANATDSYLIKSARAEVLQKVGKLVHQLLVTMILTIYLVEH